MWLTKYQLFSKIRDFDFYLLFILPGQRSVRLNLCRLLRAGARRIRCICADCADHMGNALKIGSIGRGPGAGRIDQPFTYYVGNDSTQRHDHAADLLRGVCFCAKESQHANHESGQRQPEFTGGQFLCPIDFHNYLLSAGLCRLI
nr:MAG TPA: hypothetical protein [Caudoviricetes sp.]